MIENTSLTSIGLRVAVISNCALLKNMIVSDLYS